MTINTNNQTKQQLTPEQLFQDYQHIAEVTLHRTLGEPHAVAKSKNTEYEDLLQIAYIGLWNACTSYVEGKSSFQTYAINNIKWTLFPALDNDFNVFKYPSNNIPEDEYFIESFDSPIVDEEDARTLYDQVADEGMDTLESEAVHNIEIEEYIAGLTDNQKKIVKLKSKGWLETDIANHIGISKQAVDQNVNSIIKKIRKEVAA